MHSRTGETVSIYGFDDDAPPVSNVPVGTCMTAYTLETGETVILVVHQALYLGKRHQGSLLCPNQMRQHGVRVDDCPVHLSMGMNSTHSIILQEDDVTIPLQLDGTISYFNSHIPTKRELQECRHVELTSSTTWDPKADGTHDDEDLPEQEIGDTERHVAAAMQEQIT